MTITRQISPSPVLNAFGAVVLSACAFTASVAQAQAPCSLPSEIGSSIQNLSLRDLAKLLAHEGCSGGVVVPANENRHNNSLVDSLYAASSERLPVAQALKGRVDWQVRQNKVGLVLLSPTSRHVCQDVLEQRLDRVVYTGKASDMESALDRIFHGLEPLPSGKANVVGAGGRPSATKTSVWQQPVSLNLTSVTVQDTLDETVRQVPGLLWVLREAKWANDQASCDLILQADGSSMQGGSNLLPHEAGGK